MKKLFLDDIRTVDMVYDKTMVSEFDVVRTYKEFVNYIELNGLPELISFDNDLGMDKDGIIAPDGLAAAKWLVYESGLDLQRLKFNVHSANPVAAEQIKGLLNNYIKFLNKSV
ncbi:cyclic-phosphate processing receiver domain-containing protein [Mariniflexile sp. HNIBRBA6329]|uniref:cyclic-phosphate processing receiver domain-containing protein n=1 Tax=Mariniflexile sp. HNIBRBA6329 TaxID=3373088 RepID=UPI0037455A4D